MTVARTASPAGPRRTPARGQRRSAVLALAAALAVVLPAGAGAESWQVDLGVWLDDTEVLQERVYPNPGEPVGLETLLVAGVPVVFSQTPSDFSVHVDASLTLGGCQVTATASGSAPKTVEAGELYVSGPFEGRLTRRCGEAETVQRISGWIFAVPTGPVAEIQAVSGDVRLDKGDGEGLRAVRAGFRLTDQFVIVTGPDGRATLRQPDGSLLEIGPGATVTYATFADPGPRDLNIHVFLAAGDLRHTLAPISLNRTYKVVAPTGEVSARGTVFSTEYIQVGLDGTLRVSVAEGAVEVADRQARRESLARGSEAVLRDLVPRVTMVLPVDGGVVLTGRRQTLRWTAFRGAAGYLLEYTLDPAGFGAPNPVAPEAPERTVRLPAGAFTEAERLVEATVPVPAGFALRGAPAFLRVFPVDGTGQVLPGATGSDAVTLVVRDAP